MTTEAPWIGHAVGETLAALRADRGLTQREVAAVLERSGLSWSHQYVAGLEKGRRQTITASDLIGMSHAFGVPISAWLPGDGAVRLNDRTVAQRSDVRTALSGGDIRVTVDTTPEQLGEVFASWAASSVEDHAALRLSDRLGRPVTGADVAQLAREAYGHPLDQERDQRLGDTTGVEKASLRARRAQVTRRLLDEVEKRLDKEDGR